MNDAPSPLVGLRWEIIVNGKRTLNGAPHSVTILGDVDAAAGDETIFDVLSTLAGQAQTECEMEYPSSIRVTIKPPNHSMNTARTPLTTTEADQLLGVGWRFGDLFTGPGPDEQTQTFEVPIEWKDGTRHLFAATREQYREALARFDLTPDGEWLADPLPVWILPEGNL